MKNRMLQLWFNFVFISACAQTNTQSLTAWVEMSAWYVFSAFGFYPLFPASGEYVLGSPLFDRVTIHLPGKKDFIIQTVNNGPENMYIRSMELIGKKYDKTFILHEDIMRGGLLKIVLSSR